MFGASPTVCATSSSTRTRHDEARFEPQKPNAYRNLVSGVQSTGDSTRALVDRLTHGESGAPQMLQMVRSGPATAFSSYVRHILADLQDRVDALTRGSSQADDASASSGDDGGSPVHAAGYRLYMGVCRGHVYANGTARLAATLLNKHLAQQGQPITVINDARTDNGGSVPEGGGWIQSGQRRVQSWHA